MKNIFLVVLLGILVIPILSAIPLLGTDIWFVHYLGLFSFTILGLLFVLWKFNFLYVLFGSYCLFSTMVIAGQQPRSILTLLQVVFSLLTIYAISKFTPKQRKCLLWAVIVAVVIQSIWIGLQYYNLDPIFNHISNPAIDDTVGSIGSHNQVGVFFATTAPVVIHIFPYLLPIVILGLFLSTTTSAWLAFIVSSVVFTWFKNKKICLGLIFLMMICSLIFYSEYESISGIALKERLDLVTHTVKQVNTGKAYVRKWAKDSIVTCNPLFGYGLGNFMRISPYTQEVFLSLHGPNRNQHIYSHAHNDYAEAYFDLGRVGIALLLLIIIDLFYKFFSSNKTIYLCLYFSCILSHMVSACGVFTIHTATSGMMLVLFLGLFYGEHEDIQESIWYVKDKPHPLKEEDFLNVKRK